MDALDLHFSKLAQIMEKQADVYACQAFRAYNYSGAAMWETERRAKEAEAIGWASR